MVFFHVDTLPDGTGGDVVSAISAYTSHNRHSWVCPVEPPKDIPETLVRRAGFKFNVEKQCWVHHFNKKAKSSLEAMESLICTLEMAAPDGAILCFTDFRQVLVPLLRLLCRFNCESAFFSHVQAVLDLREVFGKMNVVNSGKDFLRQLHFFIKPETRWKYLTAYYVTKLCGLAAEKSKLFPENPLVQQLSIPTGTQKFWRLLTSDSSIYDYRVRIAAHVVRVMITMCG